MMLILMLMRVAVPIGQTVEGRRLCELRLGFTQRLLWQRTNLYAIGLVLILGTWGGWLPGSLELVVLVAVCVILLIPVHYIFTTEGLAVNKVIFRRWDEFASYQVQGGRISLQNKAGRGVFTLFVAPADQVEVVRLVDGRLGRRSARKEVRQQA